MTICVEKEIFFLGFAWSISHKCYIFLLVEEVGVLVESLLFSFAFASHSWNFSSAFLRRSRSCSSFIAAFSCPEKKETYLVAFSCKQRLFMERISGPPYFLFLFQLHFFLVLLFQPVFVLLLGFLFILPLFFLPFLHLFLLFTLPWYLALYFLDLHRKKSNYSNF